MRRLSGILLAFAIYGCGSLSADLRTAEQRFNEARYDDAKVWLDEIERNLPDLSADDRARFYFVRGMTAQRTGERDEALYYLALAREEEDAGGRLPSGWRSQLDDILAGLIPTEATHRARPAGARDAATGLQEL